MNALSDAAVAALYLAWAALIAAAAAYWGVDAARRLARRRRP